MNNKRPINLKLSSMKFPPMAIVSIFHRLSGIAIFVFIPWLMYWFALSLQGAAGFAAATAFWQRPLYKGILFLFGASLLTHFIAGLRHLLMDLGYGEGLIAGRRSAYLVFLLSFIAIVFLGIRLW